MKLLRVYGTCAVKSFQDLLRNWIVFPGIIVCFFVFKWIQFACEPLGIAGGFIIGGVAVAFIGLYYSWIRRSINGETLTFKGLAQFEADLFFQVMSIAFIFWIAFMLIESFTGSSGDVTVLLVAQLAAFFMFNAIPETIYQEQIEGIEGLVSSFDFVKQNSIEWFLPLVVLLGPPLLLLSGQYMIYSLALSQPLLPFQIILDTWPFSPFSSSILGTGLLASILDQVPALLLCHWFMLFRGYLFEAINHGRIGR